MDPDLPAFPDPCRGLSELPLELRAARRLTITVPYGLMGRLTRLADRQSRSTSNCAAWLLEQALRELGAGADEISLQGVLKALAAAGSGMVRSSVDPRGRVFVSP